MQARLSSPSSLLVVFLLAGLATACTPEQDEDASPQEDMSAVAEDMEVQLDASPEPEDMGEDLAEDMTPEHDLAEDLGPIDMGPQDLELPPKPWDVSVRGPYNVGYTTGSFTYTSEPLGLERTIDVVFWHPTLDDRGRRARYMRNIVSIGEAFKNASIPAEPAQFPMLIFSHGNGSIAEQSFTFTEHFASHGWVVVAPYHQDNSIFDNVGSINYLSSLYRPQDISALIDWTSALTPQDLELGGRMDHDRIVMSGHSFGAFTTMAVSGAQFDVQAVRTACESGELTPKLCDVLVDERYEDIFTRGFHDPRIKAAIPQTPGIGKAFEEGVAQIDIPMLMMAARRDKQLPTVENAEYMWERMNNGPHALFDMPNAGHFTYSNMCGLFGSLEQASDDGCNETFIEEEIALPIINHYGLAWAEYHILGDQRHEPLLSGEITPYSTEHLVYTTK